MSNADDQPSQSSDDDGLVVRGLEVQLGQTTVLDDVDVSVGASQVLSVLGPSGCGKTTLLRAIAGLVPTTHGSIRLGGVDLSGVPPHRRDIGMVFQHGALFPHRDVSANVGFGLRMAGADRTERAERVGEMLELVGLGGFDKRRTWELSGGQAQRVALARALAPAPRLLLLDEPLASLDRELRDRLVDELPSVFARTGVTVVHVTHDHAEALALADRLVVLCAGRVLAQGDPRSLWRAPPSQEVATFLGLPAAVIAELRDGVGYVDGQRVVDGLEVSDGSYRLVVPADAVHLRSESTQRARITRVVFEGTSSVVELCLAPELLVRLRVSDVTDLDVGQWVGVVVDPRTCVLWSTEPLHDASAPGAGHATPVPPIPQ